MSAKMAKSTASTADYGGPPAAPILLKRLSKVIYGGYGGFHASSYREFLIPDLLPALIRMAGVIKNPRIRTFYPAVPAVKEKGNSIEEVTSGDCPPYPRRTRRKISLGLKRVAVLSVVFAGLVWAAGERHRQAPEHIEKGGSQPASLQTWLRTPIRELLATQGPEIEKSQPLDTGRSMTSMQSEKRG